MQCIQPTPSNIYIHLVLYICCTAMTIMLMEKVVKWNWRHEDKNGIKWQKEFSVALNTCSQYVVLFQLFYSIFFFFKSIKERREKWKAPQWKMLFQGMSTSKKEEEETKEKWRREVKWKISHFEPNGNEFSKGIFVHILKLLNRHGFKESVSD